jgi:NTP pyrophosphatase (non-canonical NTP hydrolase)
MTDKINEILDILQEECAEVIQAVSKCRRFGMSNEYIKGDGTQREHLVQEIADVWLLFDLLRAHELFTDSELQEYMTKKSLKLNKWSTIYQN